MVTITIKDVGTDRYTIEADCCVLGRRYDNVAEKVKVILPEFEINNGSMCTMIVAHGDTIIDNLGVGQSGDTVDITSNLSQYDTIKIGFAFIKNGKEDYIKNSEFKQFVFLPALKPYGFVPVEPERKFQLEKLLSFGFAKVEIDGRKLNFYNIDDDLVGTADFSEYLKQEDIVDNLDTQEALKVLSANQGYVLNGKIKDLDSKKLNDFVVNDESSVEDNVAKLKVALEQDEGNNLQYHLKVNDKNAGTIDIPKDQFLKSVDYNEDTNILTFTWETTQGEKTTTIDMTDLVDIYTAGDGLELDGGKFSIKLDATTNGALSVSADGLKLDLTEIDDRLTDIESNITNIEAKDVEQDLLLTAMEEANKDRDTKINALETKSAEHEQDLASQEKAIQANTDSINELRAKDTEHDQQISEITDAITQNQTAQAAKDKAQDDRLDGIDISIANINSTISSNQETQATKDQQQDDRLTAVERKNETQDTDIQDIKDNYATKDYVDTNGGKIDSISVNGQPQTIDENKNVDLTIPTALADLQDDETHRVVTDTEKAAWNAKVDLADGATSLNLSMNPATFELTIELKNKADKTISSGKVDLPLETMVVSASYKDGTLTLTLQNGQTLDIDISSIVAGLVNQQTFDDEITRLDGEITTLQGTQTAQELTITAIEEANKDRDIKINALEKKSSEHEQDLADAETRLGTAESDITAIKQKNTEQDSSISENTSDIAEIKTKNTEQDAAISAAQSTANSKYFKPDTGIPATDLADDVQTSLGKADTAVQPDALEDYIPKTDIRQMSEVGDAGYSDPAERQKVMSVEALSYWNGAYMNKTSNLQYFKGGEIAGKTEIPRPLWVADSVTLADAGIDADYTIARKNIQPLVATGYTIQASDKIMFATEKATYLGVVKSTTDTDVIATPKFDMATIGYVDQNAGASDAVLYTEQTLTNLQKQQARANIGAGTSDFDGQYSSLSGTPTLGSLASKDSITSADITDDVLASKTYVDNKVSNIVNSAPETLDTLNELAEALGNDPNFATTIAGQIGDKASKTELNAVKTTADDTKILASAANSNSLTNTSDIESILNNTKQIKDITNGGFKAGGALTNGHGVSIGSKANSSTYGVAIGENTSALDGGAIGRSAQTGAGGSIGFSAFSGNGFSGGMNASADYVNGKYIDTIQLGEGINKIEKSLQVYGDNIYDSNTHTLTVQNLEVNGAHLVSSPIGSLFWSTSELEDSAYHLADGSELSSTGIYADFVAWVKTQSTAGKLQTCTDTQFNADVSATGSCGKYVISSTSIRIPKIGKFIQSANSFSELGKSIEAGLPNITGSIDDAGIEGFFPVNYGTGALYSGGNSGWRINGVSGERSPVINMDASRSNAIYGNSNTVQPSSTQMYCYIVVANSVKTDVQVNIEKWASDLNLKQNKLSALPVAANTTRNNQNDTVTDYWVSSDGNNWYRLWASGWKECGGTARVQDNSNVVVTLSGITFSNKTFRGHVNGFRAEIQGDAASAYERGVFGIEPYSNNQARISCARGTGDSGSGYSNVQWSCYGY